MRVLIITKDFMEKNRYIVRGWCIVDRVDIDIYALAEIIRSKQFGAVFIEYGENDVNAYVATEYVRKIKTILDNLIGGKMPETFRGEIIGGLWPTLPHPAYKAGEGFIIPHKMEEIIKTLGNENDVQILSYRMELNPFYMLLQKIQRRAERFVRKMGQKLQNKRYVCIR